MVQVINKNFIKGGFVNGKLIRNTVAAISLGFSALFCPSAAFADTDYCTKEVLLAYFPENFVVETLKTFKVSEDEWQGIIKDLNSKEKDVVKLVEEKASKLQPNPLKEKTPESRNATVKIFRETILEIFGNVMKDHGITDDRQIQQMLVDIQQQKAKNFAKCMEKQRNLFNKEQNAPSEQSKPAGSSESSSTPEKSFSD